MVRNFYKPPPVKPLLNIEDLDKKIEDIINERLAPIYKKLEEYENKTKIIPWSQLRVKQVIKDVNPIEYVIPLEDRFPFPAESFDNKKEKDKQE